MMDSQRRLLGDRGEHKPDLKNTRRTQKWVAGGALVLAGVTGPGVFFGWRNARADQARADKAQQVLTARTNILEANQTKFNGYMAELGLACRTTVELYLHDGVNAEFSSGEAQVLVSESGNCGSDQSIVSTTRNLDYAVEHGIAKKTAANKDFESKLHDARFNNELWEGGLIGVYPIVFIAAVIGAVKFGE